MDRIDLHLEVPRLKPDELLGMSRGESSSVILERVPDTEAIHLGLRQLISHHASQQLREFGGSEPAANDSPRRRPFDSQP